MFWAEVGGSLSIAIMILVLSLQKEQRINVMVMILCHLLRSAKDNAHSSTRSLPDQTSFSSVAAGAYREICSSPSSQLPP